MAGDYDTAQSRVSLRVTQRLTEPEAAVFSSLFSFLHLPSMQHAHVCVRVYLCV